MNIPEGFKYALISAPDLSCDASVLASTELGSGLWATRQLPLDLPKHWKDWLGTLKTDRLNDSELCLVAVGPSQTPTILDAENEALGDRVHRLYFGVLIAVPNIGHLHAMRLTGARHDGQTDVREVMGYPDIRPIAGSPHAIVAATHLADASALARAIEQLGQTGAFRRLWRILRAFYAGLKATEAGDRIHEFVRSVEGLILPDIGNTARQFVSRTELFVGPRHHVVMRQSYDIRSNVEHLHNAIEGVVASSERERRVTLLRRAFEMESLARWCVRHLLLRREVWPYFKDDAALKSFWALPERERATIWSNQFDLSQVSQTFEAALLDDADLGL